jgi:prepilin-type N-terminal cleavage/methylation domain-containing protein
MMLVKSLESRVKSQMPMVALRSFSGSRLLTLDSRLSRRGVTLIELLVVILIISILAALVLGVAAVAAETARQAQTKHIVERLHTLLTEFYGTFKTRRVKLQQSVIDQINAAAKSRNWSSGQTGQALAEARLYAMRELMLMEVPDRWSDVTLAKVGDPIVDAVYFDAPPIGSGSGSYHRTALTNVYLRRYQALLTRTNSISGVTNTATELNNNEGAECLYMIITLACGDGEARSLFKEADIGDSDGDGAPEFLDGWGHPINFLRWSPGFDSQIQTNANNLGNAVLSNQTWMTAAAKDHDPFDVYRVDPLAFRLVPLIYSPGRDESSGVVADEDLVVWRPITSSLGINNSAPYIGSPKLIPYAKVGSPPAYLGTSLHVVDPAIDETSTDNIHNHLLGQR